jgi:uncharacterized protein YuzE
MYLTYDKTADAAYLYLEGKFGQKSILTIPSSPTATGPMIQIDLDANHKIIGFEILDASKFLPESVLASATKI